MLVRVITFANTTLVALVVGSMFGIWLSGNPVELPPAAYARHQQHAIRALNRTMPILGWSMVLLTLTSAVLARRDRRRLALLVAAAVCFAAAGAVTRVLNQPINAVVMTWVPDAPPENWEQLRDAWWQWHVLRTAFGLCGMSLLIARLVADGRATSSTVRPRELALDSATQESVGSVTGA